MPTYISKLRKSMKVLLVTQNYFPFTGGVETQVRLLAHELARRQHHVKIAAVNFGQKQTHSLPAWLEGKIQHGGLYNSLLIPQFKSYQDEGVLVEALIPTWSDRLRMLPIAVRSLPLLTHYRYTYHVLCWFGYQWYRPVFQAKLEGLLQDVDIVHTHTATSNSYLGWATQAAAQRLGIPCVCTPYVHPHAYGDDPVSVAYYKRCQAVIALLESDRQYLMSLGIPSDKIRIIGVSPDLPATANGHAFRKQHGLEEVPIVLYIGRMVASKGGKALLEAAQIIWKERADAHFVFIGPSSPEAQAWFEDADPRIHYLGRVSTQEKANALAACDIFCMPSLHEILPTVYLEAWSYGKLVVGGKAPGLPELIEGNVAGFSVEQDPIAIGAVLTKLIQNPELRHQFGYNGKTLVQREYSVQAITSAIESLYQEMICPPV
jgi:phosphatidyl-myo-inositol dimannoside synthase